MGWLAGFAERHGETQFHYGETVVGVTGSDGALAWIDVPFPPFTGGSLDAFADHVTRARTVGVVLVRRGGHAAGVFRGAELVSSKVGSSYVQGTTKAGGWSQQRYARRRENQASAAFAEAAEQVVRIVVPHVAALDAVFCGGDRAAVAATLADPRLADVRRLVTEPFFAVGDPRLKVLAAMPEQFLAVRIRLFP